MTYMNFQHFECAITIISFLYLGPNSQLMQLHCFQWSYVSREFGSWRLALRKTWHFSATLLLFIYYSSCLASPWLKSNAIFTSQFLQAGFSRPLHSTSPAHTNRKEPSRQLHTHPLCHCSIQAKIVLHAFESLHNLPTLHHQHGVSLFLTHSWSAARTDFLSILPHNLSLPGTREFSLHLSAFWKSLPCSVILWFSSS